jgi:hypothetical protein
MYAQHRQEQKETQTYMLAKKFNGLTFMQLGGAEILHRKDGRAGHCSKFYPWTRNR